MVSEALRMRAHDSGTTGLGGSSVSAAMTISNRSTLATAFNGFAVVPDANRYHDRGHMVRRDGISDGNVT
jgi:hypothetical protein